ncbi:MAG TPA: sugar ABC transporter permease [Solirubrobacteraceae bacterium]|nr:sugar ABC transporter permease [Solirubrobacteraceae bacterium]
MSTQETREPLVEDEEAPSGAIGAATVEHETLSDYVRGRIEGLRAGELGNIPIIIGIILIAIYFQSRNSNFLTAGNFDNLIVQMAPIAVIGMGIVFVLLLGEIDLSVGFVSGVGGAICAVLLLPGGASIPTAVAIIVALGAGLCIGLVQGTLFAKVGIPSFVVTLAGLLAWNGVVLEIVGSRGTIVIQDSFVNGIANNSLSDTAAWVVVEGAVALYAAIQYSAVRGRKRAGLPNVPTSLILIRIGVLAILGAFVVIVCNSARGLPYVGVLMIGLMLFWTFITDRTRFGRHVFAVGGNAEAARRAGIRVDLVRIAVFGISGFMAAMGGIILASRLSSVDTNAGGGSILLYSIAAAVIGGTSLFGGRGTIRSAILGAVVIASIDNGLGLLNVSAGTKFIVTGLVLLAAVTVDSLSRKGRESAGRA